MKCKNYKINGVPTEWKGVSKDHTLELMFGPRQEASIVKEHSLEEIIELYSDLLTEEEI